MFYRNEKNMVQEKRNILIIDSDKEKIDMLVELLHEKCDNLNIIITDNGSDAFDRLLQTTMDMFILDVVVSPDKTGDTSGFKIVEHIREVERYIFTPVIFVTAVKNSELYAYSQLHCLGYVKKPYSTKEIEKVLEYALKFRTQRREERTIVFRNRSMFYPIVIKEIACVEWICHQMYIHLGDGNVVQVPYRTCKSVLEEIDVDYLIQCSRNTLINKRFVLGVDVSRRTIILKNNLGTKQIGPTYNDIVLKKLGIRK